MTPKIYLTIFIIIVIVCAVVMLMKRGNKKHRRRFLFGIVLPTKGQATMNISGTIPATWSDVATASFEDAGGTVRLLASTPVWSTSDATVATVTPAADGLTATILGVAAGTCTVTVTAEGDPTPGKDTITGTIAVTVTSPEATQVVLTLGTPTPPAAPAPAA